MERLLKFAKNAREKLYGLLFLPSPLQEEKEPLEEPRQRGKESALYTVGELKVFLLGIPNDTQIVCSGSKGSHGIITRYQIEDAGAGGDGSGEKLLIIYL